MFEIFGVPSGALFGQLLIGLINGAFYATLSIGLAVIFGLLNIINFAHGAQYTAGAFVAWMLLNYLGIGYWWALVLAPLIIAAQAIYLYSPRFFPLENSFAQECVVQAGLWFAVNLNAGISVCQPPGSSFWMK